MEKSPLKHFSFFFVLKTPRILEYVWVYYVCGVYGQAFNSANLNAKGLSQNFESDNFVAIQWIGPLVAFSHAQKCVNKKVVVNESGAGEIPRWREISRSRVWLDPRFPTRFLGFKNLLSLKKTFGLFEFQGFIILEIFHSGLLILGFVNPFSFSHFSVTFS